MIDYCTWWPDGWPKWLGGTGVEWADCCKAHDEYYAAQTSLDVIGYTVAHVELGYCIASTGVEAILVGIVTAVGVAVLGAPYVIHRHNKLSKGAKK